MKKADVLIVGAGPTGLTLALDLTRRNIPVRIFDRILQPHKSSRAKGLKPRSMEVFDNLEVSSKIMAAGSEELIFRWMEKDKVLKETSTQSLTMARTDTAFPYGVMVPQWRVEQILREELSHKGVQVEYNTEVLEVSQDNESVSIKIKGNNATQQLRYKYVVGCDGGKSFVRKTLGINFKGTTYESFSALIGDVEVEGLKPDAWHMWHHPVHGIGMSLCPLPGTNTWQLQAPAIPGSDGKLPLPTLETFQSLFYDATGMETVTLTNITWGTNYRVNERVAEKFRVGNVFIAGDAAHVHSIAGGLGMNTGIQDAYNLGWKLAAVLNGCAKQDLLDTYEQERLPIAEWTIMSSHASAKKVIQSSLKGTGGIEQGVNDDGTQLNLHYRNSILSRQLVNLNIPLHAGDRAPNSTYYTATGAKANLFDSFRGGQFIVIGIGPDDTPIQALIASQFGATVKTILISDESLSLLYGAGPAIYIIRPDGYVGLVSDGCETQPIIDYLTMLANQEAIEICKLGKP